MIKFEILCAEGAERFISDTLGDHDFCEEELREIVDSFLELCSDEDIEVGLTVSDNCVLARIFDMGRYMFVYPIEMNDEACAEAAIEKIREYAVREELPLVITDIPAECIGYLAEKFNHTVIDREVGGESFRIEARGECALLLGRCPEITLGELTLRAPEERDIPFMARLNRDKELNKFWGYDYSSDVPDADDGYFLDAARGELLSGAAIALAAEARGEYIGEAVLYGFDLMGGAEFAVRILPEHQGQGYGALCVEALCGICGEIGISRLFGRADERNIPSHKMMEKTFEAYSTRDGVVFYKRELRGN